MAIDYAGRGIRVNAVCPGFIDTPMLAGIFKAPGMEDTLADVVAHHKLGRLGRPEEIAAAAAFLLSEDASFITGHALRSTAGTPRAAITGSPPSSGSPGPNRRPRPGRALPARSLRAPCSTQDQAPAPVVEDHPAEPL